MSIGKMKLITVVLLLAGIVFSVAAGTGAAAPALPVPVPDRSWQSLEQHGDWKLQGQLERGLRTQPGWSQLIARNKFAVALVDISNPARPRFAEVNGDEMMYAASLPKIAILLAAVDAVESGKLVLDEALENDLNSMIRTSSNRAATDTIDRLGGLERVNAVLMDPRFNFYDRDNGGGLWVGKRYAKKGKRVPDPVKGISHGATATQVARFYYRMATGRLISPRASERMLAYMADPALHHKFVNSLGQEAPEARLYRKSGTWKHWHSDSVLVWGPNWRRYILVGMVEDRQGEEILRTLVGIAEGALQNAFPAREIIVDE